MTTSDPFEVLAALHLSDDAPSHGGFGYLMYLANQHTAAMAAMADPPACQHVWTGYGPTSTVQPPPESTLGPLYVRWRACITCAQRDIEISATAPQTSPCGPAEGTGSHGKGQATTEPAPGGAVEEHPKP